MFSNIAVVATGADMGCLGVGNYSASFIGSSSKSFNLGDTVLICTRGTSLKPFNCIDVLQEAAQLH